MECLIRMFGTDLLYDRFGWMELIQALGVVSGPPIGGALYYVRNQYNVVLYLSAVINLCSAALIALVTYLHMKAQI